MTHRLRLFRTKAETTAVYLTHALASPSGSHDSLIHMSSGPQQQVTQFVSRCQSKKTREVPTFPQCLDTIKENGRKVSSILTHSGEPKMIAAKGGSC